MSTTRRGFLLAAGAAGVGACLPGFAPALGGGAALQAPDLVLGEDEGEVYLIGARRGRVVIKADRRRTGVETMSLVTEDIVPDDGIPVHKHGREEEFIHIARGRGTLTFGEEEHAVAPGAMALVPRGVWHGLQNTGDETLRMVFGYTPAGFEGYFREIGVRPGEPSKQLTDDDWARIDARFHIVYR